MKRYLNTLFVTTQDTWLSKQGECVELHHDGQSLGTIPLHTLQSIACFGRVSCSPYLLEHCAALGVTVSWFPRAAVSWRLSGADQGERALAPGPVPRDRQPRQTADLARSFLIGKVANWDHAHATSAQRPSSGPVRRHRIPWALATSGSSAGRRPGDPARAGRRCRPDILELPICSSVPNAVPGAWSLSGKEQAPSHERGELPPFLSLYPACP